MMRDRPITEGKSALAVVDLTPTRRFSRDVILAEPPSSTAFSGTFVAYSRIKISVFRSEKAVCFLLAPKHQNYGTKPIDSFTVRTGSQNRAIGNQSDPTPHEAAVTRSSFDAVSAQG